MVAWKGRRDGGGGVDQVEQIGLVGQGSEGEGGMVREAKKRRFLSFAPQHSENKLSCNVRFSLHGALYRCNHRRVLSDGIDSKNDRSTTRSHSTVSTAAFMLLLQVLRLICAVMTTTEPGCKLRRTHGTSTCHLSNAASVSRRGAPKFPFRRWESRRRVRRRP